MFSRDRCVGRGGRCPAAQTYTYDGHATSAQVVNDASERGPRALYGRFADHSFVDVGARHSAALVAARFAHGARSQRLHTAGAGCNGCRYDPDDRLGRCWGIVGVRAERCCRRNRRDAARIVYRRTDLMGSKPYIGRAKNDARYIARQAEHALCGE